MQNIRYILLLFLALSLWNCDIKTDDFETSKGEADFSSYVALGDSYSAGYSDGALGYESQLVSLPNLLAMQFAKVGGGEFKQPLFPVGKSVGTTVIDTEGNLNGYFNLNVTASGLKPVPSKGNKEEFVNLIGAQGPYNNMAVPGAKSIHLVAPQFGDPTLGTGNFNPFYVRFASQPGVSTVMEDALKVNHSFFSLWIGGNDVLTYALAGGTADSITSKKMFEGALTALITQLTMDGKKGVIANIPDIDALPYFNVVPFNALPLTKELADQLNEGYAGYNLVVKAAGYPGITFVEGQNALVIEDPKMNVPDGLKIRQITASEKLLLNTPTDSIATKQWGSKVPIPAKHVLCAEDIKDIKEATAEYNTIIKKLADDNGLAFVDLYSFMNEVKNGKFIDGIEYKTVFVQGGIFSLDGIHATPRGYAIIANEFIKAINVKYNASVPLVTINEYRTVIFP